jgi:hypothetical protein
MRLVSKWSSGCRPIGNKLVCITLNTSLKMRLNTQFDEMGHTCGSKLRGCVEIGHACAIDTQIYHAICRPVLKLGPYWLPGFLRVHLFEKPVLDTCLTKLAPPSLLGLNNKGISDTGFAAFGIGRRALQTGNTRRFQTLVYYTRQFIGGRAKSPGFWCI